MKPELKYLSVLAASGFLPRQIVVFTDPDWQGRMFRTYLDDVLPLPAQSGMSRPQSAQESGGVADGEGQSRGENSQAGEGVAVRHAFLRVELGTSAEDDKYHEAGNVGVEHATPDTIRSCIKRARRSFGTERREFTVEELRAVGLVGSWQEGKQMAGSQQRRHRFCRALGIDEVGTGKALVNLLNRFFTREEYSAALQTAGHV